jgi:YfiH family protein
VIQTLQFKNFAASKGKGIRTFVSTRNGGVSIGPFESLNLSYSTGDTKENVTKNRLLVAQSLGISPDKLISARQEHGVKVWQVEPDDLKPRHADILVTDKPGLALMVLSADCVPIVLADLERRVITAVHAGRRGTAAGAVKIALKYMTERFACSTKNIVAGIGPAIAQQNYEVGAEVVSAISLAVPSASGVLKPTKNGHAKLDLVAANVQQLVQAGIREDHIEVMDIDTFGQPEQFYSARRQKPFGCFGTGIILD